jgi:NhaP-type Na+/H+ or K+/H+ antiporter
MSLLPGISINPFRGLIGLAVGGISGGIIGAILLWFVSWLRENPEEQAWILAGTWVGFVLGITCGSALGFIIGLVFTWKPDSNEQMLNPTKLR